MGWDETTRMQGTYTPMPMHTNTFGKQYICYVYTRDMAYSYPLDIHDHEFTVIADREAEHDGERPTRKTVSITGTRKGLGMSVKVGFVDSAQLQQGTYVDNLLPHGLVAQDG